MTDTGGRNRATGAAVSSDAWDSERAGSAAPCHTADPASWPAAAETNPLEGEQEAMRFRDAAGALIGRLSASLATTQHATLRSRVEVEAMQVRLDRDAVAMARLTRERDAERALNVALRARLEHTAASLAEASSRLTDAEDRATRLERQLSTVLVSSSWQLTRGWRAYKRLRSHLFRLASLRRLLADHFDAEWYMTRYPDVRLGEIDPLVHFIRVGAPERRDPNPLFHTEWYVRRYPDVERAGINPLAHFCQYGVHEGRDPHPQVTYETYVKSYP